MEFSEISTRNELADFLGIPRNVLSYVLYVKHVETYYTTFDIPKKDGSARHICAPSGELKAIQSRLKDAMYEFRMNTKERDCKRAKVSQAFEQGKSIITNADIHRNKRYVIGFDLKDFFDSFNFGRVSGYFEKNRYFKFPHEVAIVLAQLCCYNGVLPQGAPTSPIITNMISEILDARLLKLARKYKLDYTRYADDLTFSTNNNKYLAVHNNFLEEVVEEIKSSGFSLNEAKTHITYRDSQQVVTGLIVNRKINVPRTYYKATRAMWHSYYSNGHFTIKGKEGNVRQLEGRFSFIDQVEHYNNCKSPKEKKHDSHNLSSKEKEYRNFLFYTHFVSNPTPILLTEGKTDVLYIKAALMKLYKEYPTLIQRDDNGKYRFNISFFNRTNHWNYFFDMSRDGADAMSKIYTNYFSNGQNSLSAYFQKRKALSSNKPVLFLFDNECNTKGKPLQSFVGKLPHSDERKKELQKSNHLLLDTYCHLYLVTLPLPADMAECELEDLFPQDVLHTKIRGRSFSRKDEDPHLYYNKDIFF